MSTDELDMATIGKHVQEYAEKKQRGWFRRNWKWFVPFDLFAAVVIVSGILYWNFYTRVYDNEVCQSAMLVLAADPTIREALGEPVQEVRWPSREMIPNARIEEGEIDIIWHIQGPKGQAKAHWRSAKRQGKWDVVVQEVTLANGKKLSIRTATDTGNEAKPWTPDAGANAPISTAKRPETKESDLNVDLPLPPADGPTIK